MAKVSNSSKVPKPGLSVSAVTKARLEEIAESRRREAALKRGNANSEGEGNLFQIDSNKISEQRQQTIDNHQNSLLRLVEPMEDQNNNSEGSPSRKHVTFQEDEGNADEVDFRETTINEDCKKVKPGYIC